MTRRIGSPRHGAFGARALAVASLGALLALAAPAAAQAQAGTGGAPAAADPVDAGTAAPAAGTASEDVRDALSREIARMKADIAEIGKLARWQADLARIARTDRAEALRQRLPMADCLASALAPLCDELTGLFRPEDKDDAGPVAGGAPATEGEGAR